MEPFLVGARVPPGEGAFFGGPSKHDDVGPTSERDVAFRRRADAAPHRSDVGPLPGR